MVTLLARRTDRKSKKTQPRLEALEERSLLTATVTGVTLDPSTIPLAAAVCWLGAVRASDSEESTPLGPRI